MFEHSLNKTGLSRHSSSAKTGFTTGFWPPPFLLLFASRSILLAAPCSISRHWPRENSLFSPFLHCQMRRDCLTHKRSPLDRTHQKYLIDGTKDRLKKSTFLPLLPNLNLRKIVVRIFRLFAIYLLYGFLI